MSERVEGSGNIGPGRRAAIALSGNSPFVIPPFRHSAIVRFPPMHTPSIPGFRPVPFTGVIYVMAEAAKLGYRSTNPQWCNLGQGQPETGLLPGAPPRVSSVPIDPADQDYAPVSGVPELRAAVAELYNQQYRKGMKSQYSEKNVCIWAGAEWA